MPGMVCHSTRVRDKKRGSKFKTQGRIVTNTGHGRSEKTDCEERWKVERGYTLEIIIII